MSEKRFDFRKRITKVHRENIRDFSKSINGNEIELKDGIVIALPEDCKIVLFTAAKDFVDYLLVSQRVSASVAYGEKGNITFQLLPCIEDKDKQQETFIDIGETIQISAYTERGLAQGLYRLEKLMNIRRAPFLKKAKLHLKPLFFPRMVHSSYGLDIFPEEYLSALAHNGISSILLCVKGVNQSHMGFLDFNELCDHAEKYGINIYIYCFLRNSMHPADSGAKEFYDNLYGVLFEKCPRLAGLVLVGESMFFPSKDPNTTGEIGLNMNPDVIPSEKSNPGWWPCEDYPLLVNRIKDAVRKYSPKADIIFWTYNWGYAPEKDRIKLINSLPSDVSLLATFEMFEKVSGTSQYAADYTLSVVGPGKYFSSEADAAKKRGIRLYTMCNTAGKTWDFGSIPYQPMPYQWMKRYDKLKEANKKQGLCGLMESHTYGLYPSFISELANSVYSMPDRDADELLGEVLSADYGEENVPVLKKALAFWSDAMGYYTPSNEDQYGAFRIGPAYPFNFTKSFLPKADGSGSYGEAILMPDYDFPYIDFGIPPCIRIDEEIVSLKKMRDLMSEGIKLIETLKIDGNSELAYLLNLGRYIYITITTGINAKEWHKLKSHIKCEFKKDKLLDLIGEAKKLLQSEIENSKAAIPLVKMDSSFGYEASMGYLGDEEYIHWKIRQVEYVINHELKDWENRLA